jgi:hypothetical protein
VTDLPATVDRPAVRAEGAGEALGEVERREVRLVSPQLPDTVLDAHPVDASDPARVEVVLEVVALALGIGADDRDPVGRLRERDLPALDQEALSRQPLEADPGADISGRHVLEGSTG